MRRSWLIYVVVYSFFVSTLAVAEVRKVTRQDIEWTSATYPSVDCTVTSPGLHVGNVLDNTYQLSSPYVDVRAHGTALTHVPIQAALSAIDNSAGAEVFIPRGQYEIGNGLYLYNKSNVTIRGAGKDVTILRGNLGTMVAPAGAWVSAPSYGILSVGVLAGATSKVSNIHIKDLTFWLDNTGTPGSAGDDVANGTAWIKNVYFQGVENITFENVKIRGSRWEALYADTGPLDGPSTVRVINSDFYDTQHNAFNINTGYSYNVSVHGCYFDNTAFGIQVVGDAINISNNIFKDVRNGIIVAETNYTTATSADTRGVTVNNNLIYGLGQNTTVTSNTYGILVTGGESVFVDNTVDNGLIVSNNYIINSVKRLTNGAGVTAFRLSGGHLKVSNNHVSGLTDEGGSGDTVAYAFAQGSTDGISRSQVYFSGNTLDNTLSGDLWDKGVSIGGGDNTSVYMSNNVITGVDPTNYSLYVSTATGSPFVSLHGDIFNSYILYSGKWERASVGVINDDGKLNNTPLFGDSNGAIGTLYSKNVLDKTFTDNATTPSVIGSNIWSTANTGATTITNFTGPIPGQEITVLFTDNITAVQNNANIKLAGATDFIATTTDTLRLIYSRALGYWLEIGRSVN